MFKPFGIIPEMITPLTKDDKLNENALRKLTVILYTNPDCTNVKMAATLVSHLAQIENIVGMKDSSGDLTLATEYLSKAPVDFCLLRGRDTLIFSGLLHGAKGATTPHRLPISCVPFSRTVTWSMAAPTAPGSASKSSPRRLKRPPRWSSPAPSAFGKAPGLASKES